MLKSPWRIQDFPDRGGASTPEFEAKTYYLARFLWKTAWKWKKLDPPMRQHISWRFSRSTLREVNEVIWEVLTKAFALIFHLPYAGCSDKANSISSTPPETEVRNYVCENLGPFHRYIIKWQMVLWTILYFVSSLAYFNTCIRLHWEPSSYNCSSCILK